MAFLGLVLLSCLAAPHPVVSLMSSLGRIDGGVGSKTDVADTIVSSSRRLVHNHLASGSECPSMFVAVLSAADHAERRMQVRQMWAESGQGWGTVTARFAVCSRPSVSDSLQQEANTYGDVLLMDCEEGYFNSLLTRKVRAALTTYLENYSEYKLFMKTDDDTWISTARLCEHFQWRIQADAWNGYFGVFAEGPLENMNSKNIPIRDPDNAWYEPVENFAGDVYPRSARGGPGYILPHKFVDNIINYGIAQNNVLNNEDKAVGVWVDELNKTGVNVEYVNLPGTDGYELHRAWIPTSGTYRDYPFAIHHHLTGEAIACMHQIRMSGNEDRTIDECFPTSTPSAGVSFARQPWGMYFTPKGPRIHQP